MPITQAMFWGSTIYCFTLTETTILLPIAAVSVIMWLWAIRQKLGPTPKELGVFTWPLNFVSYAVYKYVSETAGNVVGMIVALLMFLNYYAPAFVLFNGGLLKIPDDVLAGKSQKTLLWAKIVKFNFKSALGFFTLAIILNILEIVRRN